jgi:hypothetical protein
MVPITSLCLKHWEATFLSKNRRLQGQLLVFLDWVVFVPNNTGGKKKELDIKISIRTLEFVRNHGDHLTLNVLTEPCEDLTEPSFFNVRTRNDAATQRCNFSKGLKFSNGISNGLTIQCQNSQRRKPTRFMHIDATSTPHNPGSTLSKVRSTLSKGLPVLT